MIVGFSGYMGAGKDTAGQRLIDKWGFTRVSFAEPLKLEVMRILPRTLRQMAKLSMEAVHGAIHMQNFSDEQWEEMVRRQVYSSDRRPVFRALLQEWGTDLRRNEDPDYWVKRWKVEAAKYPNVVVTDCRFLNEAAAIKDMGGSIYRIEREGKVGDSHPSETIMADYKDFTGVLYNDRTIQDLWDTVDNLLGR